MPTNETQEARRARIQSCRQKISDDNYWKVKESTDLVAIQTTIRQAQVATLKAAAKELYRMAREIEKAGE